MLALNLSLLAEAAPAPSSPECPSDTQGYEEMVDRINQRYDDFFRVQREREEREEQREAARGDIRKAERERQARLEEARQEYIRNRRPKPDTRAAELEWEQQQKEKAKVNEASRHCYVQNRAKGEAILKRGRAIPGMKEFDIEP